MLTRVLHDRGYRTGHFGKWHQWAKPGDPQYGLDEYLYTGNNVSHVDPGYDGEFDGTTIRKPGKLQGDDSEIIVRRCLEFVDRAVRENKPFYANLWFGQIEDLWQMGKPRGVGGPWQKIKVAAGKPSPEYLMTGFDRKKVEFSHDGSEEVTFSIEVDFLATTCIYENPIQPGVPGSCRGWGMPPPACRVKT